jgi:hypothetical protein
MRTFALVLALAMSDPKLSFETEQGQAAFDEASEAFAAKDYERAADALARAHALEPQPELIYARAQAERLAGRCSKASPLYIDYLDTQPSADSAALVRWNLSLCLATMSLDADACEQAQTQLGAIRADAEGDQTKSKQLLELEVRLEACRAPAPAPIPLPKVQPESPPPVEATPAPPPVQRRRVDPWGVGLGAGSVLLAGTAVGLFLGGQAQLDAVSLEGTHGRARSRIENGRALSFGGIGAAAAAGGLAVGAVVHWLIWRKRQEATATARR